MYIYMYPVCADKDEHRLDSVLPTIVLAAAAALEAIHLPAGPARQRQCSVNGREMAKFADAWK